jgi:hypothetical protein
MRISLALCLGLLVGCGSSHPSGFAATDDGGTADDSGFPTDDGGGGFKDGGATDSGNGACSDASKFVYLLTNTNDLYSFDPGTLALKKIGTLDCPTASSANSMAVDRNALAYVNMSDGTLFTVNTQNAHCSATTYALGQQGRTIRGMGFSADTNGGTAETLYTCTNSGLGGGGLAKISLPGYTLSTVGDFTNGLAGSECELTGTGDARLFGFFALSNPTKLAEITKTSAATPTSVTLGSVPTASAYAFSFWGGDFWFYTSNGFTNSQITRYRYSTNKSFSAVVQNTGMIIVGAGVSTCAPLIAPN